MWKRTWMIYNLFPGTIRSQHLTFLSAPASMLGFQGGILSVSSWKNATYQIINYITDSKKHLDFTLKYLNFKKFSL